MIQDVQVHGSLEHCLATMDQVQGMTALPLRQMYHEMHENDRDMWPETPPNQCPRRKLARRSLCVDHCVSATRRGHKDTGSQLAMTTRPACSRLPFVHDMPDSR